jgi:hypothetical protein
VSDFHVLVSSCGATSSSAIAYFTLINRGLVKTYKYVSIIWVANVVFILLGDYYYVSQSRLNAAVLCGRFSATPF